MKKILLLSIILILTSCVTTTTLTENGKVGKGHLKNNMKQGKWTFFVDGNIYSVGNYSQNNKNGNWKYFYDNGKLHQKGKFINDKQNGIWNYYFDSGAFMGKGQIINNNQNGLWKWYHKNGNLYTERFYDNGRLLEIKSCLDKNGNELNCGKIVNGNGILFNHDTQNETDTIEQFKFENGILKN